MPRRFTPDHKATILALLEANHGNIPITAEQVNITERTLYRWKREHQLTHPPQLERQSPLLTQYASESQEDAENELLRRYLRQAALQIASQLPVSIQSPDLTRLVSALNGVLNRLDLMEEENPQEEHTQTIQIEYVDAEGKVYPAPSWTEGSGEEEPYLQPFHDDARIEDEV